MTHHYLIALGSNMRHRRYGLPGEVLTSALTMIASTGCTIEAVSPVMASRPVGPSQRDYANAVAVITSPLTPHAMLDLLQGVELLFGRERRGRRWRARTLDLDIILWDGGIWASHDLAIPHPRFRERGFVLGPAAAIAPKWRDPVTGLSLAQLNARLTRAQPLTRGAARSFLRSPWGPLAQSVEQLTFNQ